jgi:hypothetical protein
MDSLISELCKIFDVMFSRIASFLSTAPPGTIQVTSVLGLAALLVGYYHLRGNDGDDNRRGGTSSTRGEASSSNARQAAAGSSSQQQQRQRQQQQQQQQQQHQAAASAAAAAAAAARSQAKAAPELQSLSPTARAVRTQLPGVRKVTISAPGVLLEQLAPAQLQESATLLPGVGQILQELASLADVYVITHVEDDVGQAAVQGALDAAGLVGPGEGRVRAHKLLFCSSIEGKVSMVRQLEPDLHVDAAAATVQELRRFMPQLLHVAGGAAAPAAGAANVRHTPSLSAFFGL